jgi:capsular exopolysaccharide synthesis family protein
VTLRAYMGILRKRWLLVLALTVFGVGAAAALTFATPKTYAAQATAFVATTSTGTESNSIYQNSQFAMQRVKSYSQVINSPDVLQPVLDQLHLDMSLDELQKMVAADNPVDTVLINVTARSKDPVQAQAVANAAAQQLGLDIERLETARAGGTTPVKVSTAVPAPLPQKPVSPRPLINMALGLLLGLALGVGAAVLREQQDTTIKGDELQDLCGRAPLGVIGLNPSGGKQPLVALQKHSAGVEAFRSMRTNLQFVDVDCPPRMFVLTSATANEGKTTTACNLAITLAQASLRVCLVEADLRRSKLTSYLGIDGSVGLTDVLAGQFKLDDVLVPWNRGLLTVLPAGTTPPDPSELLGSRNMTALLAELRSRFDMVIIDAPPVLPVSDAAVLARATDGALFVARYGHARREQVAKALEDLATVNARLIGTVLSFVPPKANRYVHGHDYGYGYTSAGPPPRPGRWRTGQGAERTVPVAVAVAETSKPPQTRAAS